MPFRFQPTFNGDTYIIRVNINFLMHVEQIKFKCLLPFLHFVLISNGSVLIRTQIALYSKPFMSSAQLILFSRSFVKTAQSQQNFNMLLRYTVLLLSHRYITYSF